MLANAGYDSRAFADVFDRMMPGKFAVATAIREAEPSGADAVVNTSEFDVRKAAIHQELARKVPPPSLRGAK
jgi:hypothetical protein